jgi:hypothetical protein
MKVTINTETKTITLFEETSIQELIQFINDFGLSDWTLEGSYPQIWTQPYTYTINPFLDTVRLSTTTGNTMTYNCTLN